MVCIVCYPTMDNQKRESISSPFQGWKNWGTANMSFFLYSSSLSFPPHPPPHSPPPHCTFLTWQYKAIYSQIHFCQFREILTVNSGHGYYTIGRIKRSMELKSETERKVNCPHNLSPFKLSPQTRVCPYQCHTMLQSQVKRSFSETLAILNLQNEKL